MATNTTTPVGSTRTERIQTTVRVPRDSGESLATAVNTFLLGVDGAKAVTIIDSGSVDPRLNATHVTVTAELTMRDVTSAAEIADRLEGETFIESASTE